MKNNKFAAFVLSHGRANCVYTYQSLRDCGYTGNIYIIVDDEDEQLAEYKKRYKKQVIVFNKAKAWENVDYADTVDNKKTALPARNICFKLAKKLGLTHFIELDDDYTTFRYRFEDNGVLKSCRIKKLDRVFDVLCNFLNDTPANAICFAQGGDFVGGISSAVWKRKLARKAMNAFVCKTDRPFEFLGRINEDVTAYTRLTQQGYLFFTLADITIQPMPTQTLEGGVSDVYASQGTYTKSFYSVMFSPSCVKIASMGGASAGHCYRRIHHFVEWDKCAPCIISDKYRKAREE